MIDPTAELSIDRTTLGLGPLVYSAEIVDMNEPALIARNEHATSRNLDGAVILRSTWENSNLNALIRLEGTTAAELEAKKAELRAAVGQFSTDWTQTLNGQAMTYTSQGRGNVSQAAGGHTFENLSHFTEVYQVSIPVYPIGV